MLVLQRKRGESLRIGDSIVVVVLQCDDGRVKIGVSAPPDVPVHRSEVYELIKKNGGKK